MIGGGLSLRERAVQTWKYDRPMKEAERLELKTKYLEAVRRKLVGMFGSGYEIKIGMKEDGRVTAEVDDVRFSTFIYNEDVITIIPMVTCPSCEKEVSLGGSMI
jgi:hypothetical protein